MEKNSYNQTEQDNNTKHIYSTEQIIIDERRYAVVSIIPIRNNNLKIATAKDKIKHLISGGKE